MIPPAKAGHPIPQIPSKEAAIHTAPDISVASPKMISVIDFPAQVTLSSDKYPATGPDPYSNKKGFPFST